MAKAPTEPVTTNLTVRSPDPTADRQPPKRQFGALRGIVHLDDIFFDPLPEEELALWE